MSIFRCSKFIKNHLYNACIVVDNLHTLPSLHINTYEYLFIIIIIIYIYCKPAISGLVESPVLSKITVVLLSYLPFHSLLRSLSFTNNP